MYWQTWETMHTKVLGMVYGSIPHIVDKSATGKIETDLDAFTPPPEEGIEIPGGGGEEGGADQLDAAGTASPIPGTPPSIGAEEPSA